jgi:hypothetical protein
MIIPPRHVLLATACFHMMVMNVLYHQKLASPPVQVDRITDWILVFEPLAKDLTRPTKEEIMGMGMREPCDNRFLRTFNTIRQAQWVFEDGDSVQQQLDELALEFCRLHGLRFL